MILNLKFIIIKIIYKRCLRCTSHTPATVALVPTKQFSWNWIFPETNVSTFVSKTQTVPTSHISFQLVEDLLASEWMVHVSNLKDPLLIPQKFTKKLMLINSWLSFSERNQKIDQPKDWLKDSFSKDRSFSFLLNFKT